MGIARIALRRLLFTKEGRPTNLFWLLFAAFVIIVGSLFAGCANLYTRSPWTDAKLEETYQPTKMAMGCSFVVAFPQCMSDNPSDYGFQPVNVISIPLGLLVFCDGIVEGALDTVCFPADYFIVKSRKEAKNGNLGK